MEVRKIKNSYQNFRFYIDSEKADFNHFKKCSSGNNLGNSRKIPISISTVHDIQVRHRLQSILTTEE